MKFADGLMQTAKRLVRVAVQQFVPFKSASMGYTQAGQFVGVSMSDHIRSCTRIPPKRKIPEILACSLFFRTRRIKSFQTFAYFA